MEMTWQRLPSGAAKLTVTLDDHDRRAIQEAFCEFVTNELRRESLPDPSHDDADYMGRVLAEICRGWLEGVA